MDKLTLLYIAFLAVVIILAVCFFALNDSCKKSEQLSEELANHMERRRQNERKTALPMRHDASRSNDVA